MARLRQSAQARPAHPQRCALHPRLPCRIWIVGRVSDARRLREAGGVSRIDAAEFGLDLNLDELSPFLLRGCRELRQLLRQEEVAPGQRCHAGPGAQPPVSVAAWTWPLLTHQWPVFDLSTEGNLGRVRRRARDRRAPGRRHDRRSEDGARRPRFQPQRPRPDMQFGGGLTVETDGSQFSELKYITVVSLPSINKLE